jgi:hypothetical protein
MMELPDAIALKVAELNDLIVAAIKAGYYVNLYTVEAEDDKDRLHQVARIHVVKP